jgi:hypothetical protein
VRYYWYRNQEGSIFSYHNYLVPSSKLFLFFELYSIAERKEFADISDIWSLKQLK